jgi:hypothetical protein
MAAGPQIDEIRWRHHQTCEIWSTGAGLFGTLVEELSTCMKRLFAMPSALQLAEWAAPYRQSVPMTWRQLFCVPWSNETRA